MTQTSTCPTVSLQDVPYSCGSRADASRSAAFAVHHQERCIPFLALEFPRFLHRSFGLILPAASPRPLSSHTAAVGRWKPFDGLPARLGVHERDGLEARGSAAGVSAHVAPGNAAVICQHLQGQVVVLTGAHACPHTVLKHHDLVRVVAEAQITHLHLFPLQTTVLAAPATLTVAPLLTVPRGLPWTGAVCRGTLPPDSMTLTFLGQGRIWGDREVTTDRDQT